MEGYASTLLICESTGVEVQYSEGKDCFSEISDRCNEAISFYERRRSDKTSQLALELMLKLAFYNIDRKLKEEANSLLVDAYFLTNSLPVHSRVFIFYFIYYLFLKNT